VDDDVLQLAVIDNGRGMPAATLSIVNKGVGLSNTRSRLERLYGDHGRLLVGESTGGGVTVQITLPLQRRKVDEDSSPHRRRSTARA
jgi:sensor histidine kinase YesM